MTPFIDESHGAPSGSDPAGTHSCCSCDQCCVHIAKFSYCSPYHPPTSSIVHGKYDTKFPTLLLTWIHPSSAASGTSPSTHISDLQLPPQRGTVHRDVEAASVHTIGLRQDC